MGIENLRADLTTDPTDRIGQRQPMTDSDRPSTVIGSRLDTPEVIRVHGWLQGLVLYEKRRQAANRMQMALDCDYYDGLQFTDDDIFELIDRGQSPLVYNLVKRTADWVIGTEKRTRFDFKVHGRTKDDVEAARIKTDVMKYYQDVNRTPFHRSQAFREAVIAGVGWLEDGVRADPDEEPIYATNESWWFTLHDSHAMKLDHLDARYHFRWRYMDLDVAEAMFPDRARFIVNEARNGATIDEKIQDEFYLGNRLSGEDYLAGQYSRLNWSQQGYIDSSRERLKVYEGWFKKPVREKTVLSKRLPQFHGQRFNPSNDDMRHAVVIGDASVVERLNMRAYYMLFTESGVLAAGRSPYRHNEFPFTPIWCYRRGRDNAPYGIIRNIRDPQDGFNRRMAKAIFALTAYRVTADADAIDPKTQSWDELRVEAGRPDALIVQKKGSTIKVEQDRALGEEHLKLAQTEGSLILDASGVTADNLGLDSNAESGKAIIAKQSEGAAVTAEVFDNYRLGCQLSGEKQLSLIEQYATEEKVLRVTDSKGRPSWKKINEITVDPQTGEAKVLNDIAATKADFVIDQQDFRATQRQAANEALMDVLPKFGGMDPKLVLRILRMAIDISDWPNKDDMVKEIDGLTGYKDPEAALTEEEKQQQQQAEEAEKAAQQKADEMKEKAFNAELNEKIASAEQKRAAAAKLMADADAKRQEIEMGLAGPDVDTTQVDAEREAYAEEMRAHEEEIARLRAELEKKDVERYRADKDYQSKVDVAALQNQGPDVGVMEMVADMAQDMKQLTKVVQQLVEAASATTAKPTQPTPTGAPQ